MMKAVVINKYGGSKELQIADVPVPKYSKNELLIRVKNSSINPIEVIIRKGGFRFLSLPNFPKILGSDFSGIVHEVGENVKAFAIGDEVYGMSHMLKGGSYAEYMAINKNHVCLKPNNFSFAEAASMPLVCLTTMQALNYYNERFENKSICINGASGGVGIYAIQIAKILGMKVTGITSNKNIALVKSMGADDVIDYTNADILRRNVEFNIFYDAFGNLSYDKIKPILNKNGLYVSTIPSLRNYLSQIKTVFGNKKAKVVVVKPQKEDLEQLKLWCEKNKIKPIIDSTFDLSKVQIAHEKIQSKRTRGKIIIDHTL